MADLYTALTDKNRRRLLFVLLENNPQEEILIPEDLQLEGGDRESIQIEMHHVHLPKMESMGLIEWDRRNHEVVEGPEFNEVRPVLETLREHHETTAVCR